MSEKVVLSEAEPLENELLNDDFNNPHYFYMQMEALLDASNVDGALLTLTRMADAGHIGAMIALAEAYKGVPTLQEDFQLSFKWWQKAANAGHPIAQFNFGKCYENGKGVEVDRRQALEWYLKSAEQGYDEAVNVIGIYFAEGYVVEQDEEAAFLMFKRASESGKTASALYNLASCYERGFGTEVNLEEARRLRMKADKLLEEDDDIDWATVGEPEGLEVSYH